MILYASYLAFFLSSEARGERTLALAPVRGPQRAAPKNVEAGVKHALSKAGIEPLDPAAAELLLEVSVIQMKKKLRAEALLTSTRDGSTLWSASRTYVNRKQAWKIGRTLARLAIQKLEELPVAPKPIVPVVAKEEPPPAPPPALVAKVEEKETKVELTHPDDKLFRAALFAGSQLSGEYTVSVAGAATGLAYELHPTALLSGELMVNLPWLPISAELSLAYVPMFYDIDVDPQVTPDEPGARHLDVAASIGYGVRLWWFAIRPLVGVTYRSLAVEKQEPINVLVGSRSIAPHVGLRAGIRIGDVTAEVNGLLRLVVSYRESPDTTGDGGFGYSALIGGAARYWITDFFGVYADVHYDFTRVAFDGAGTRVKFAGDPALLEATLYAAEIRAALGVTFAL